MEAAVPSLADPFDGPMIWGPWVSSFMMMLHLVSLCRFFGGRPAHSKLIVCAIFGIGCASTGLSYFCSYLYTVKNWHVPRFSHSSHWPTPLLMVGMGVAAALSHFVLFRGVWALSKQWHPAFILAVLSTVAAVGSIITAVLTVKFSRFQDHRHLVVVTNVWFGDEALADVLFSTILFTHQLSLRSHSAAASPPGTSRTPILPLLLQSGLITPLWIVVNFVVYIVSCRSNVSPALAYSVAHVYGLNITVFLTSQNSTRGEGLQDVSGARTQRGNAGPSFRLAPWELMEVPTSGSVPWNQVLGEEKRPGREEMEGGVRKGRGMGRRRVNARLAKEFLVLGKWSRDEEVKEEEGEEEDDSKAEGDFVTTRLSTSGDEEVWVAPLVYGEPTSRARWTAPVEWDCSIEAPL